MTPTGRDRLDWETAGGGARTGEDVPVTSEPRDEVAPGVPARERILPEDRARAARPRSRPARPESGERARRPRRESEEREVRAEDPEFTPETNALLTEELREVVGRDRVRVPAQRPHPSRGQVPQKGSASAYVNEHRFVVIRTAAIVLTFGAIVALATGDWWILPLAAAVHALGTMTVMLTIIRMTTVTEHPSPEVAAAMAEEGVSSPDERFTQMVDEFSEEAKGKRGAGEVLSPGYNERSADAQAQPATAAAEQSSAITPTAQPSRPGGAGGAPEVIIWVTAGALLVLSLVLPAVEGGGWLWLLTAVMVPLLVGWVMVERLYITRAGELHLRGRGPLVTIVLSTAIAVAVFCAVVALAFQH